MDKIKEESKKGEKKGTNFMSGRALFKYDPTLFQDDEAAAGQDTYDDRIDEEEESKEQEITKKSLRDGNVAVDADLFQAGEEEEPDFE